MINFKMTIGTESDQFLRDRYKEIEENDTMGKTRDLFKKTGGIKGTFHARMDMIKDRNGKDLTEAGESKKRRQEYTEELYSFPDGRLLEEI